MHRSAKAGDGTRHGSAMAKVYDGIDAGHGRLDRAAAVFFVATAPLAADGLVNLSPKGGTGTFRVVDEHTFAYLDMTGSGVETSRTCGRTAGSA